MSFGDDRGAELPSRKRRDFRRFSIVCPPLAAWQSRRTGRSCSTPPAAPPAWTSEHRPLWLRGASQPPGASDRNKSPARPETPHRSPGRGVPETTAHPPTVVGPVTKQTAITHRPLPTDRSSVSLTAGRVNAKVWAVRIAYLHRRGPPTALRDVMLAGVRPQRRYDHGKEIRPGTGDPPDDPACLIHKRPGRRIVLFVCNCYNVSMHNPPDNLSASPPWPPGFSNAPDPSRCNHNIVPSRRGRVKDIRSEPTGFFAPDLDRFTRSTVLLTTCSASDLTKVCSWMSPESKATPHGNRNYK